MKEDNTIGVITSERFNQLLTKNKIFTAEEFESRARIHFNLKPHQELTKQNLIDYYKYLIKPSGFFPSLGRGILSRLWGGKRRTKRRQHKGGKKSKKNKKRQSKGGKKSNKRSKRRHWVMG